VASNNSPCVFSEHLSGNLNITRQTQHHLPTLLRLLTTFSPRSHLCRVVSVGDTYKLPIYEHLQGRQLSVRKH
jgi:hypothetical protein